MKVQLVAAVCEYAEEEYSDEEYSDEEEYAGEDEMISETDGGEEIAAENGTEE